MATAKELVKLGEQLLAEPLVNANNTGMLLAAIANSGDNEEKSKAAIRALQLFFLDSLQRGELLPLRNSEAASPVDAQASSVHKRWLQRQHKVYEERLLDLFMGETSPSLQVAALLAVLELAKAEEANAFKPELFCSALEKILCSQHAAPEVLAALISNYLQYLDIRYYVFRVISKVAALAARSQADSAGPLQKDGLLVSQEDLAQRLYTLLSQAKPLAPAAAPAGKRKAAEALEEAEPQESWCRGLESGAATPSNAGEGTKQRKKRRQNESGQVAAEGFGDRDPEDQAARHSAKWMSPLLQKKAFSRAWLAFLSLPLPDSLYKQVLLRMHEDVIPHLANPLMLADLLTGALDSGGLVGMLALHAIFVLVTQHGLEYPDFYARLYQLLQPSAFFAKQRSRFFQLADVFLASGLVPAYTMAAFIKRFARLALSGPPAGALICLGFVHNLLRRHPACLVLINRQAPSGAAADATEPSTLGEDVFLMDEPDPASSRAIESSLWEVKTLCNHYYYQVAALAKQILEKDFSDRRKTSEVDMGPLVGASYSSLITAELGRRIKQIPTAFYHTPPTRLFDTNCHADFVGWSFD